MVSRKKQNKLEHTWHLPQDYQLFSGLGRDELIKHRFSGIICGYLGVVNMFYSCWSSDKIYVAKLHQIHFRDVYHTWCWIACKQIAMHEICTHPIGKTSTQSYRVYSVRKWLPQLLHSPWYIRRRQPPNNIPAKHVGFIQAWIKVPKHVTKLLNHHPPFYDPRSYQPWLRNRRYITA